MPNTTRRTPNDTTTRLVQAKRASRKYGIAYGSLRDIVQRGELAVIKVGRAWYLEVPTSTVGLKPGKKLVNAGKRLAVRRRLSGIVRARRIDGVLAWLRCRGSTGGSSMQGDVPREADGCSGSRGLRMPIVFS